MALPTAIQIISQYLWESFAIPNPASLPDDKWIRPTGVAGETTIFMDALEYMTVGGGRFVTVDWFNVFKEFFDKTVGPGAVQLAAATYTLQQVADVIYGKNNLGQSNKSVANGDFILGPRQYYLGMNDADYADRAYVFGSTEFKLNDTIEFVVNPDVINPDGSITIGSREVRNILIIPVADNFNYESTDGLAGITNFFTESAIDPSAIGRTVNINFDVSNLNSRHFNLTENDFLYYYNSNAMLRNAYEVAKENKYTSVPVSKFQALWNDIVDSGVIDYLDENGKPVLYDGANDGSLSVADGVAGAYRIDNPSIMSNIANGVVLIGGAGNDVIGGAGKKDILYGGTGNDILSGEDDDDYLYGGVDNDTINGDDGNDQVFGEAGNDTLMGGDGNDNIEGGADDDTIYGDDNEPIDRLIGGNDTLRGGAGKDNLNGEGGDDTLYGDAGIDELNGGDGKDTLYGGADADTVDGDNGEDTLYGDAGNDTLNGGDEDDTIYGGADVDTINGDGGKDKLYGDAGKDTLDGGAGDDQLDGGADNDELHGGDNKDTLKGGAGQDKLFGDAGDDTLQGEAENDFLYGGEGKDKLDGGAGNDYMEGENGNDELKGGEGIDALLGGEGNDTLEGGKGRDTLEGGAGKDKYEIKRGEGGDTITDSDGSGSVSYSNSALSGGKNKTKGDFTYYDNEKSPTYSYTTSGDSNSGPVTLSIRGIKSGELIATVEDFKNHQLGIHLKDKEKDPIPPPSIADDMGKASYIPSPIILDLDGDGVETSKQGTGTYFDHEANGFAESTGWAGKDDGLLVRDIDGNGLIDTGRELFGSETLLANGNKAANGFAALAELDSNHDGKIDSSDAAFSTLQIWQDANSDGYSSEAELKTLTDAGIQSINLNYTSTAYTIANPGFGNTNIGWQTDANNNQHRQLGSYTSTDGATHAATDVWLQVNKMDAIATTSVEVSNEIDAMPDLEGYGNLHSLHQAMVRDSALKDIVLQFTQATTAVERNGLINTLIYRWAGVENINPASRAATMIYGNAIGDARKLEALEEFVGEEWYGVWCWGTRDHNPHGRAAPVLLKAYNDFAESHFNLTVKKTSERVAA